MVQSVLHYYIPWICRLIELEGFWTAELFFFRALLEPATNQVLLRSYLQMPLLNLNCVFPPLLALHIELLFWGVAKSSPALQIKVTTSLNLASVTHFFPPV